MKVKINWKYFVLFFVVCGGIYYLTRSFLMTLGIMLILFVIDGVLRDYDNKRRGKKNQEEIMRHLNDQEDNNGSSSIKG